MVSEEFEESISDRKRFFGLREMIDLKMPENIETDSSDNDEHSSDIEILVVEDNAEMRQFLKSLLYLGSDPRIPDPSKPGCRLP